MPRRKDLRPTTSIGPVKTSHVLYFGTPLFSAPDEVSPKVAYLREGTVVELLGYSDDFVHVRTAEGGEGFLRKRSLAMSEA
jgi:hypothetical protein